LEHPARGVFILSLYAETSHRVDGLGGEADVTHHRNPGGNDTSDGLCGNLPPLELDRFRGALLHQAPCSLQSLLARDLEAHERHIQHQMSALDAASNATAVIANLLERHGERVPHALNHHSQGVADEQDIGTSFV